MRSSQRRARFDGDGQGQTGWGGLGLAGYELGAKNDDIRGLVHLCSAEETISRETLPVRVTWRWKKERWGNLFPPVKVDQGDSTFAGKKVFDSP